MVDVGHSGGGNGGEGRGEEQGGEERPRLQRGSGNVGQQGEVVTGVDRGWAGTMVDGLVECRGEWRRKGES
ncbi:hypothetical protein AMTR_s00087p00016400 [Amborella trichopoda]|uniref:Uncharacterized protein n=1 Tax=Amborella trichopoda TaxID=13333 RepID=W1P4H3_AMBTC|nr:hypothetical protein AMTR_s00087p00016400 [Amborella trichopoda]